MQDNVPLKEKTDSIAKANKTGLFTTRNIAVMAMLTAVSFVLYLVAKFPLPFIFPGFLDMPCAAGLVPAAQGHSAGSRPAPQPHEPGGSRNPRCSSRSHTGGGNAADIS